MQYISNKYRWLLLCLILVITAMLIIRLTAAEVTACQVLVDGKSVAYIKDQVTLNDAVADLQQAQEKKADVTLASQVDTRLVKTNKSQLISKNDLQRILRPMLTFTRDAVWIVVDGKEIVALADKTAADQVLEQVKQEKVVLQPGETITNLRFIQNVCFLYYPAATNELKSVAEAKNALLVSSEQMMAVKVKEGDNLWDIARKYNIYVADIMVANKMTSDKIKPDEIIKVPLTKPRLTVVAQVTGTKTEPIPFNTRVINDPRVRATQVVTKGVAGEKQVSYSITRNNGVVVAYNITTGKVLQAPVEQVEKRRVVYQTASRSISMGGWTWPVIGTITSPFGGARNHTGLDIGAPIGRPIYASRGGKVIFAGSSNGYGLNILVDHGAGYVTRYAHCSRLYVSVGDRVQAGDVIAAIGITGNTTGPHLHFEIIYNDNFINPASALRG